MLHCTLFLYFLAMKTWNFHYFLMLVKAGEGEENEGEARSSRWVFCDYE